MASGSSHLVARCRLHFSLKWSFKWDTAILGSVLYFFFFLWRRGAVKFPNSARWHPTSEHQADLLMKGRDGGINRDGGGSTSAEKGEFLQSSVTSERIIVSSQNVEIHPQLMLAYVFANISTYDFIF